MASGTIPAGLLDTLLLALIYLWQIVETAYFQAPEGEVRVQEAPLLILLPTWLLIGNVPAALADGETIIENAACEPEIEDLGEFLNYATL